MTNQMSQASKFEVCAKFCAVIYNERSEATCEAGGGAKLVL